MNYEIQLFKTFKTVENLSIDVDPGLSESAAVTSCFSTIRRYPQAATFVHKSETADSQVLHGLNLLPICSEPVAYSPVTPPIAHAIDSPAARFSTTAKSLKL